MNGYMHTNHTLPTHILNMSAAVTSGPAHCYTFSLLDPATISTLTPALLSHATTVCMAPHISSASQRAHPMIFIIPGNGTTALPSAGPKALEGSWIPTFFLHPHLTHQPLPWILLSKYAQDPSIAPRPQPPPHSLDSCMASSGSPLPLCPLW